MGQHLKRWWNPNTTNVGPEVDAGLKSSSSGGSFLSLQSCSMGIEQRCGALSNGLRRQRCTTSSVIPSSRSKVKKAVVLMEERLLGFSMRENVFA